ncbi:DUF2180 family protein [Streptomyces lasiicapitis]|uniref:DUF2180 family protein n=1 Tax=Streptomyces lasiicapitis TaxID=1923961 RepID=UPI00365D53E4
MRCYDCSELGRDAPASAVCTDCGAAACAEHVTAVPRLVHRAAGMGRSTGPVPGRRMVCPVCRRAAAA